MGEAAIRAEVVEENLLHIVGTAGGSLVALEGAEMGTIPSTLGMDHLHQSPPHHETCATTATETLCLQEIVTRCHQETATHFLQEIVTTVTIAIWQVAVTGHFSTEIEMLH